MEDFNKKLDQLKSDVVSNIKNNLPLGQVHTFVDSFYCTMLFGDTSDTFVCDSIKHEGGDIIIHTKAVNTDEEYDDLITKYEIETIIFCYEQLLKEQRKSKLDALHNLREKYPDGIKCDGTFSIRSVAVEGFGCTLDGNIVLDFTDNGESCYKIINEDKFTNDELVELLSYFEDQLSKQIDISLTPTKQTAVEKFKAALKELKEQKVVIIEDHCTDLFAFANGDGIKYTDSGFEPSAEDDGYFSVDKQVGELESVDIADFAYFSDSALVLAKKD